MITTALLVALGVAIILIAAVGNGCTQMSIREKTPLHAGRIAAEIFVGGAGGVGLGFVGARVGFLRIMLISQGFCQLELGIMWCKRFYQPSV